MTSIFGQAWDAWGAETAGARGHFAELDMLDHCEPAARRLALGMWGPRPCVVGAVPGQIVVASEDQFARSSAPVSYVQRRRLWVLHAGQITVEYLGLAECEAIARVSSANAP